MATISEAFTLAVEHHRAGRFQATEEACLARGTASTVSVTVRLKPAVIPQNLTCDFVAASIRISRVTFLESDCLERKVFR